MKFAKLAMYAVIIAFVAGCSSTKEADTSATDGTGGTGYSDGANANGVGNNGFEAGGAIPSLGLSAEEANALRAITTFYFNYDSSDIQPDSTRALDVHAYDLKNNGKHVVLQGNTDERGTREYNMALGERRAAAVKNYLTMQGVSPSQLELVSYGKERPAVSGHDEAAWAKNRRVELVAQ